MRPKLLVGGVLFGTALLLLVGCPQPSDTKSEERERAKAEREEQKRARAEKKRQERIDTIEERVDYLSEKAPREADVLRQELARVESNLNRALRSLPPPDLASEEWLMKLIQQRALSSKLVLISYNVDMSLRRQRRVRYPKKKRKKGKKKKKTPDSPVVRELGVQITGRGTWPQVLAFLTGLELSDELVRVYAFTLLGAKEPTVVEGGKKRRLIQATVNVSTYRYDPPRPGAPRYAKAVKQLAPDLKWLAGEDPELHKELEQELMEVEERLDLQHRLAIMRRREASVAEAIRFRILWSAKLSQLAGTMSGFAGLWAENVRLRRPKKGGPSLELELALRGSDLAEVARFREALKSTPELFASFEQLKSPYSRVVALPQGFNATHRTNFKLTLPIQEPSVAKVGAKPGPRAPQGYDPFDRRIEPE